MSKPKKEYVILLEDDDYKQMIRDWVGTHNGISILKSDWCYIPEGFSLNSHGVYILGITNPKTEMLFVLSFPNVVTKNQWDDDADETWEDWAISPSRIKSLDTL